MKLLNSIFRNKITYEILGLLFLSLIIWFGLDFIKFGEENVSAGVTTKATLILFSWLVWVIVRLALKLKDKQTNAALTKGLTDNAVVKSDATPRSKAEEDVLRKKFQDSLNMLAKSKIGIGKKQLYQLPWYILIGPPGAGKTTALSNSGLNFPLLNQGGQASVEGVGGTLNCDWWFTDEGVLIDTAGRFTTQENDKGGDTSGWFGFLNLLKKYRKRRPLNGVLVVLSASDLLLKSDTHIKQLAQTVRKRLDELYKKLGTEPPVYLVISKLDLLEGFSAYYQNLNVQERNAALGFALNHAEDTTAELLKPKLGGLLNSVETRVFRKLNQEREQESRQRLQSYPSQFEQLLASVLRFTSEAFSADNYREQPFLRGLYFSSATQEGNPIDRMMSAVSGHFNLGRSDTKAQFGSGKSYFLQGLFKNIIFPEANLGGVNAHIETRLLWTRRIMILGAATITFLAALAWSTSTYQNQVLMEEAKQKVDEFSALLDKHQEDETDLSLLHSTLSKLDEAKALYSENESPWIENLGLYDEGPARSIDHLYKQALRTVLLPELRNLSEKRITRKLKKNDKDGLFTDLKVYLMLEDTARRENAILLAYYNDYVAKEAPSLTDTQQGLAKHITNLFATPNLSTALSEDLVAKTRKQLLRQPAPEMVYQVFLNQQAKEESQWISDQASEKTLDAFGITLKSTHDKIPYQFTREAYVKADFSSNSKLVTNYKDNRWVLGQTGDEEILESEVARIAKQVRNLYLDDYLAYWENRAKSLSLNMPRQLSQLEKELQVTADASQSPIRELANIIRKNTQLTLSLPEKKEGSLVGEAVKAISQKALKPTRVDRKFKDLHKWYGSEDENSIMFRKTFSTLEDLRNYVADISLSSTPSEDAFNAVKKRFVNRPKDAIRRMFIEGNNAPYPVSKWLTLAANRAWSAVVSTSYNHSRAQKQSLLCSPFKATLENRFPFANVTRDANANDFNEFFKPMGIEDQYTNQFIRPFIDINTKKAKSLDGLSYAISEGTLSMMKRAQAIRSAYFTLNKDAATLELEFTPIKLDRSVRSFSYQIDQDQARISYRHGPKLPTSVSWVAGKQTRTLASFIDVNGTEREQEFNGDWSLVRALYANQIQSENRRNLMQMNFDIDGRQARYQVKSQVPLEAVQYRSTMKYECSGEL